MKVGPFLFLTMPGEPMVEYGFKLEAAIADRAIPIIVGYANGRIGYIATEASYEVGGYEPETSQLAPEAEAGCGRKCCRKKCNRKHKVTEFNLACKALCGRRR